MYYISWYNYDTEYNKGHALLSLIFSCLSFAVSLTSLVCNSCPTVQYYRLWPNISLFVLWQGYQLYQHLGFWAIGVLGYTEISGVFIALLRVRFWTLLLTSEAKLFIFPVSFFVVPVRVQWSMRFPMIHDVICDVVGCVMWWGVWCDSEGYLFICEPGFSFLLDFDLDAWPSSRKSSLSCCPAKIFSSKILNFNDSKIQSPLNYSRQTVADGQTDRAKITETYGTSSIGKTALDLLLTGE